jgi:transposase
LRIDVDARDQLIEIDAEIIANRAGNMPLEQDNETDAGDGQCDQDGQHASDDKSQPKRAGAPPRVEVITSVQRRRRWPTAEKIRLVEETMQPGMSVSYVARRAGVAPSLLFNWRRRMLEGGLRAVEADEDVVGASRGRELERRVRELERLLGRKTMEV